MEIKKMEEEKNTDKTPFQRELYSFVAGNYIYNTLPDSLIDTEEMVEFVGDNLWEPLEWMNPSDICETMDSCYHHLQNIVKTHMGVFIGKAFGGGLSEQGLSEYAHTIGLTPTDYQTQPKWVCEVCGGTNIQIKAWCNPNTNIHIEDLDSSGECWCGDCNDTTRLTPNTKTLKH
jgi:hypothetical protein